MDLKRFIDFVGSVYVDEPAILHRPVFIANEKAYLAACIDSNFVSSVGVMVSEFESQIVEFTGAKYAIATVNGTAALHVSLQLAGVSKDTEVITQAMTFIATCNAISYLEAKPLFIDIDPKTLGLSPTSLYNFLSKHAESRGGKAFNRKTGKRISACVPMHTFGHPCDIEKICEICNEFGIPVVEDAAESLGSYRNGKHTGTFGLFGTFSFNGNKIITTGGGGMIVTDDEELARKAKHITTTSKIPHPYEFEHDEIGYNYRLPNLNAALGCAQMEQLEKFLEVKRDLAYEYEQFFRDLDVEFIKEPASSKSNYWLNSIRFKSRELRDEFLVETNKVGIMTRPAWKLMSHLQMFKDCQNDGLANSIELQRLIVNIPSSVPSARMGEK